MQEKPGNNVAAELSVSRESGLPESVFHRAMLRGILILKA
jgi:hypothetical protein